MTILITNGGELILPDGSRIMCSMGKGGLISAADKREGDGCTPMGRWQIVQGYFRADRLVSEPKSPVPMRAITPLDGWCDDPKDPAYNQAVTRPYPASHEVMMREDGLYDLVLVLDHNSNPPVPGLGSAIFLHCRRPNGGPTAGCIALDKPALISVLEQLEAPAWLDIRARL